MAKRELTSSGILSALVPTLLGSESDASSKFMTSGAPGGTFSSLFTSLGRGQPQQTPQMPPDMSQEGMGASAANMAGGPGQPKQSFWKTPGGSILGTLLGVLGTSALGAGLGALSGGRRGAGEGAMLGGAKAFLTDLAQRQSMASAPALQQEAERRSKEAMMQYTPTSYKEAQLAGIPYGDYLKQQQAAKTQITPYQQAMLGLKEKEISSKADRTDKGKILPESAVTTLGEGMSMPEILGNLSNSIRANKDILGPSFAVRGLNPYDTRAQGVRADIDRTRQLIGKFLEGGVLRKEDETKYQKILAEATNDPKASLAKIYNLEQDLYRKYNNFLESHGRAGYNTSNYQKFENTSKIFDPKTHSALQWAYNNPEDPRAKKILSFQGVQ